MQTSKTRSGSSEVPQKTSPITPRPTRQSKAGGIESDSPAVTYPATRTPTSRSPKVIDRRSPRSTASEKKRTSRVSELESLLTQAQEELKKTKDQLSSSESWRQRAQQEADEGKKQLMGMAAKLEDSQHQLLELSASEEARVQELWKLSQERDRAWQSELEAVQKQHSIDSGALLSAMNEIQRLKLQLEMLVESEAAKTKQAEIAHSELSNLKQDMEETLSLVGTFKRKLSDCEKSEVEYQEQVNETQMQLEVAKVTVQTLRSNGLKVTESLTSVAAELEVSKARVNLLEEIVRKLQADEPVKDSSQALPDPEQDGDEHPQENEFRSLQQEVGQLKSAREAAEIRYQEEQVKSTMLIQSAYELVERTKIESGLKEAELGLALKETETEIAELKASLTDKETRLQGISDLNERLNEEIEKYRATPTDSKLESKLKKSMADVADLKANLMDKETELQSISEENELLKLEMEKKEAEMRKNTESTMAELEAARAAEQDAMKRLGFVTEEGDKSSRRAARVAEQLEAARTTNSEMDAELRRLRTQSEQWRKAAEAAAAILTTGNNGGSVERSGSMDSEYHFAGKLMSSPYSDDMDEESPKKKNNNVLRRIGVLWKKGQKSIA